MVLPLHSPRRTSSVLSALCVCIDDRRRSSTSARKRRAPVNEYVDDENLVDDGWTVDLSAHCSALPVDRQEELNNRPAVQVNLGSPSALPEIFTRQSLSHILGGSIQGLVVR